MEKTLVPAAKAPKTEKPENKINKVLGPVINLEDHVHPDWWRMIFNNLYLKTDADVIDDKNITKKEIDLFIKALNLSAEDKILDLCCGQGRHTIELAKRGYKFAEGIDRSHYLVQRAKATIKKDGLNIRFREGDARKLPFPTDNFDSVMIPGNSFGYFESAHDDLTVLREVFRVLRPGGKLLLDLTDGEFLRKNYQPRSWEWIDKNHFVCRERSLSSDGHRLISREVITKADEGVLADQFYAERLYSHDEIQTLLTSAGFSGLEFHGLLMPESQRNQDLGMMEQRIIVTAIANKDWAPKKKKIEKNTLNVVVLMGDPNKHDIIKPDGVFDEDDIETIITLKTALDKLQGYRFNFMDNHDALIRDLKNNNGKIDYVFNLCDEGFNNEARKELHIPALLEILGLGYTGAGPQCCAYCYDKSLVRGIAQEMEVPVPQAYYIKPETNIYELYFNFPVIVKPNFGDSSFGITQKSVCNNHEELLDAVNGIRDKFGYDKPMLVEEFLTGKDMSVGIIGNPPSDYTVLPIVEEDYSGLPEGLPRICGYEAKWEAGSPYYNLPNLPANLPEDVEKQIIEWCTKLFERLECRDYARFDWRLDAEGKPKLLEVNPNPGWCHDGHLAKMAYLNNWTYSQMLGAILQAAEERLGVQKES